jgi:hypothetical protein
VLAAYNEAAVIPRALADLRRSYYPASRLEVIAVNDGSTDEILQIMRNYARDWPQLRVISQPPSGKSSALNNGIDRARPESTVIVNPRRRHAVPPLDDPHTRPPLHPPPRQSYRHGCRPRQSRQSAQHPHRWQSLEFISGICVTRMAEA